MSGLENKNAAVADWGAARGEGGPIRDARPGVNAAGGVEARLAGPSKQR
jgi:hypothetical protein